jgi:diguanylate cyclase (GGDEF)-like protein/PAS domain S-box-containing protein
LILFHNQVLIRDRSENHYDFNFAIKVGGIVLDNNKNKTQIHRLLLGIALVVCIFSALVINIHYGIDIVYTHLFYIPIVMAGVWYQRWALVIAGILGTVHISCDYIVNNTISSSSLLRTAMFFGIALVVGILSEKRNLLYKELKKINNAMLDVIMEVTSDGRINYISPSSINLLGYTPEEMLGKSIFDLVHPEDLHFVKRIFNEAIHSSVSMRIDYRCCHKDGSYKWVESLANPVLDESQQFSVYIFGSRDISARKKIEEELQYLSMHDSMTGLYNRFYFEEQMKTMNTGRFDPVGIVVVDIDGLKLVNDNFGHDMGDKLIVAVSKFLQNQFRTSDTVARIGGDEFAVIMPNCSQEAWEEIVKRVVTVTDPPNLTEEGIPIMISAGYALKTDGKKSLDELFQEADSRMYRQKGENRERFHTLFKLLKLAQNNSNSNRNTNNSNDTNKE